MAGSVLMTYICLSVSRVHLPRVTKLVIFCVRKTSGITGKIDDTRVIVMQTVHMYVVFCDIQINTLLYF